MLFEKVNVSSSRQKFRICRRRAFTLILFLVLFSSLTQASKQNLQENNSQYIVGFKDVLEITVYGYDDLHQLVTVAEDGFISFPLIGKLQVAGKTALQIADDLRARLEKEYLYNAQVEVAVKEYRSKKITVLGEIEHPGIYYLQGNTKLLDILAQINYSNSEEKPFNKLIVQKLDQDGTIIKEITIDLHKLLIEKEQNLNVVLEDNDRIIFSEPREITIYGMVNKPGVYNIKQNTTILNAIAIAGGFTSDADRKKIIILREINNKKQRIVIDVEKINENPKNNDNILLRPRDYIIVQSNARGKGFVIFDYLKIIPSIALEEEYYDNVFAKRENITSDYMLLINPQAKLSLPFRSHNMSLEYSLGIPRFQRNPSLNNLQHNLQSQLNLDFPSRLSIGLKNSFTTSFFRSVAGRVIEDIGIIDSTFSKNTTSIEARRIFNKIYFIQASFQNENFYFSNKEVGKDYISNTFSSLIGYEKSPRLSIEMEYEFNDTNFVRSLLKEDSISHTGSLILDWQKSPRTTAKMKIGYKSINIEEQFIQYHTPVFQFQAKNILSPLTNISFQINRDLIQPILTNRLLFIATRINAILSRGFAKKIECSFIASYQNNRFPNLSEGEVANFFGEHRIEIWRIRSKVSYNINNRISLALSYLYSNKGTNYALFNITQNVYSGQVIFRY